MRWLYGMHLGNRAFVQGGGRLDLYSKFVGEYIFVLVAFLYI